MEQLVNSVLAFVQDPGNLAMMAIVSQFLAKIIPEDATGIKGLIRKLFKFLGVYTSNRKTANDPIG